MMMEVGQQIKRAREQKGLALEEIAKSSRIGLAYLRDIEQGKFDFLPRPYVLAFTKTFANHVGLNGEELSQQLKAALSPAQTEAAITHAPAVTKRAETYALSVQSAEGSTALAEPGFPYWRELLIGAGIVLLVAIALFVVSKSNQEEEAAKSAPSANNVQEMSFEEMAKQVAALADSQTKAEAVAPQLLTLEAQVETPVWIRIAADSAEAVANTFPRGRVSWQAKEKFVLRVGNAGSVAFVLDGKTLGKVGERGQRIDVIITREGFKDKRTLPPPRARARADSSGT
jgi:cytoskeletal protein RodZ